MKYITCIYNINSNITAKVSQYWNFWHCRLG